jgi:hypothetical protein
MQWKFWKKRSVEHCAISANTKMTRPKELPQQVGGYLVIKEKLDPDWVWSLRCVVRRYPERKSQLDFRVFDPVEADQKGITIANFMSLDAYPEMILYQGFYNKYVPEAHFTPVESIDRVA